MKSKNKRVSESALSKALDEMEGSLKKGAIPEEMKNPNGGLATEGKDLSDEVSASETKKGGKPNISISKGKKKGMPAEMSDDDGSDEGSSEEEGSEDSSDESMSKGGSEDGSDEVEKKYSASDESSSDSESMSKAESEEKSPVRKSKKSSKKVTKSLKERAEDSEEIAKAMNVSPFLENIVDMLSDSNGELVKSLGSLSDRLDGHDEFNGKLQKAIIAIGRETAAQGELLKSLVERLELAPDPSRQRKSMLNKSDVRERFDGDGQPKADLSNPEFRAKISAKLLQKAMAGEIPSTVVTAFESGLGGLPPGLIKSVADDIIKSESTER